MYRPVLVVPPARLPVTVAEAKVSLRVDHDHEDGFIAGLIEAATGHLDGWTGVLGRCLVDQTWRQDFDCFQSRMALALGPVIEIVSVTYPGDDGDVVVPADQYRLFTDGGGVSFVSFTGGAVFSRGFSVTYRAGYVTRPAVPADPGPEAPEMSTVPAPIKTAILLLVGAWYENRENTAIGVSVAELPASVSVKALLSPFAAKRL